MIQKNLQQLFKEKIKNIESTYRSYLENSNIPLFLNIEKKCYENEEFHQIIKEENFNKLYLIPNYNPLQIMPNNTQHSPKLKKINEEIQKILKDNDISGVILLHTPGFGEFSVNISPSYSCAFVEGHALRVKAKLNEDFNGDKELWTQKVKDTANMLHILSNMGSKILGTIDEISLAVDKSVNSEHTGKGFTNPQNN